MRTWEPRFQECRYCDYCNEDLTDKHEYVVSGTGDDPEQYTFCDEACKEFFELTDDTNTEDRYDDGVYYPPFKISDQNKKTVVDGQGKWVIKLYTHRQAMLYCNYLNKKRKML